jgi:hypothetical protein
VAKRLATLDSYLQIPEYQVDIVNIEAVKKVYIDGSLEIRRGYWTYWAAGWQKSGYLNHPKAIGRYRMKFYSNGLKKEMHTVCGTQFVLIFLLSVYKRLNKI